jgi:hypothetical protein
MSRPQAAKPRRRPPRQGRVYLLECAALGLYKIGVVVGGTVEDVERRREALQSGSPHPLRTVASGPSPDIYGDEAAWHGRFRRYRLAGEWFALGPGDVLLLRHALRTAGATC